MVDEQHARMLYSAGKRDTAISNELGITRHHARRLIEDFQAEDSRLMGKGGLVQRTVILSDLHIPFEETGLVQRILAWMETQYLQRVILNGDIMDCASISKFADAKSYPLEDEVIRTRVFLDQLTAAARAKNPGVEIVWSDGNHEYRLERYLSYNAEKLANVMDINGDPVVSIPHLLDLRGRKINYRNYRSTLALPGNLWIEHGDVVSRHSSYTAKNAQDRKGASIIIGHVHRVGAFYKRDRMGVHRAYELGCLCSLNPGYITQASANWVQGFGIVDYRGDTEWWYTQVLVQDGRFVIDGCVW